MMLLGYEAEVKLAPADVVLQVGGDTVLVRAPLVLVRDQYGGVKYEVDYDAVAVAIDAHLVRKA